ncbi:DUF6036 family nucleotidyltransferase [Lactococcus fujiensis]|uniref:DUF6036 domain-containing protein n=1 Tax=Lactococcus fujiensis JCM 16395 TaxID=1291764 RepID=A0A2A5RIZ3_9LACT|nr:DUF6036 family nucleotidyltransferase [Lactococcus fujiensis]PCR99112.1 hypothetical protein RT41_GL000495 [Lactococcus fujiensis JCM 16395]
MDYKKLFFRLNEKLAEHNLTLQLDCVGGFVLEYYGLKATDDIDAFYESSAKIESLIAEVGNEFGVGTAREAWLNHAVGQMMSLGSIDDRKVIFEASHLSVTISSLQSILIDKIQAGRSKDIPDIAKIMRAMDIKSPQKLLQLNRQFSNGETDPAIILEAYSVAFGEEALRQYLRENPDLMRLLR